MPDEYYELYKDKDVCWRPNVPETMRTPEMETKARQYFAAVHGLDVQFGRIYQYLKENGWRRIRWWCCQPTTGDDGVSFPDEQERVV